MELNHDDLKWASAKVVNAADDIVKISKNKNPWEVFPVIVKAWQESCPKTYDSFVYTLNETKANSKITKVGGSHFKGVSVDKGNSDTAGTGGTLRHRLDIPVKVIYIIRRLYPDMPMDKKFYDKWAKVFPQMKIEEKV